MPLNVYMANINRLDRQTGRFLNTEIKMQIHQRHRVLHLKYGKPRRDAALQLFQLLTFCEPVTCTVA